MVLLAGILPLAAGLAANSVFGDAQHIQEQVHEGFELAGACIALGVAMLLAMRSVHEEDPSHIQWIVAALLTMGLLDGFHGVAHFGTEWSWLRHGSTLFGGILFSLVWLPLPVPAARRRSLSILLVAGLSAAFAAVIWWRSDLLPAPILPEGYARSVRAASALGGLGYFIAAGFFLRRHLRLGRSEDLVFAGQTMIFGTSGLLFGFSQVWTANWWIWHGFRLLAYLVALIAAHGIVTSLYREIAQDARELAHRVRERTGELEVRNAQLAAEIGERRQTEVALKQARDQLEMRVAERTRELEKIMQSLSSERQRFDDVLNMMPAYVVLLSPDYHVPFANRFFEERFGKSEGRPCFEYLFQRNEPCEICESFKALRTGAPHHWEWLGPDGRNYDIYDFPFQDTDGSPLIMEMGIDVTERKLAQAGVQTERQRFLGVLEALPVMVCLLTPDHKVTFANRRFTEHFGESDGRACFDFIAGRSEPCEACEPFKVLQTGMPRHWESRASDGSAVIDVYDYPFTDSDGSPLILEMNIDITERRRSEQALLDAHEQLASRAHQLRALAGELTMTEQRERRRLAKLLHDHLQQLLVAAKFRAALVGRHADTPVKQAAEGIEILLDEAIKGSRLLTAELSPPILLEGGLGPGIEWLARWMADKHGLDVKLSMDEDIVPLPEDVKALLFESVRELLFNAVKHAHVHEAAVNMRVVEGKEIRISVSDEGAGFDPAALKPPGEAGGGFGLFSIRERLDLIGGRLTIESAPGEGSRFLMTAPLNREGRTEVQRPDRVCAEQPAQTQPDARAGARIRVIVADDHPVMRDGLARLLGGEADMEVIGQASDGQMAVAMTRRLRPDVILMDLSMPHLSGLDATRIITMEMPDVKVIVLSMFDESERAQALFEAGAAAYLTKGTPSENILAGIRNCTPSRQGR